MYGLVCDCTGSPGLSVVVNAAGITRDKSLLKMTEDAYDEVLKVNLKVYIMHIYMFPHPLKLTLPQFYIHSSPPFELKEELHFMN